MKKILNKQTLSIGIVLILVITALVIAQAPPFRPAQGIPAAVEEIRLTVLSLAKQQHAEITAQIASETASDATYVFTTSGYIEESIWLLEAQAAADYWAARIAILEAL